jgi:hypothetical protein
VVDSRKSAKRKEKMEAKVERKSFPEALRALMQTLEKGSSFSVSELSRETDLNRRTVEKALRLLEEIQTYLLENKLEMVEIGHTKVIHFSKKSGLLNLPEELQKLIIRTAYYPNPSRQEEILVYLYRQGGISPQKALEMEKSALVKKLIRQGQLHETSERKVYLTDEGKIVAEGALKLYPELKGV